MMKTLFFVAVLILTTSFGFSKKETGWRDNVFNEKELRRQPANVNLPSGLWEKLEAFARKTGGLATDAEIDTEFVAMKAFLIEKNRGILGRENFELKFPVGGGEVDLADFIQPLKGSFYFATEFLPDLDAKQKKVYFLSNSPVRTLLGAKVGAGCDAYYDVTGAFAKAMAKDGFLVNTTEARHVGALVGTYFFAGFDGKKLRIASLEVRDSKYRSLHCRRN